VICFGGALERAEWTTISAAIGNDQGVSHRRTPAICIAVARCVLPLILVRCIPSRSFPKSVVRVTSISGPLPPIFIRPTEDSGFACVLAEKIRLTASACASHLDGLYRIEAQSAPDAAESNVITCT